MSEFANSESANFIGLSDSSRRAPKKLRWGFAAAAALFIVTIGVSAVISLSSNGMVAKPFTTKAPTVVAVPAQLELVFVHMLGAVNRPGIVQLTLGARVIDAVAAAGGYSSEAETVSVNLARTVVDGEQIFVPKIGEIPAASFIGGVGGAGGVGGGSAGGKVSLNLGNLQELDTLPRIGPAMAQRIIDWRSKNGPFKSIEQLREVAGIGDATFAGLKDLVTL